MPRILLRELPPQCESHLIGADRNGGECSAPFPSRTKMRTHITIDGELPVPAQPRSVLRAAPAVIIFLLASVLAAHADTSALTTTSMVAAPLATVVVDGSTIYRAPRLFAAYREQLGHPLSSEGARAIATALVALYEQDGYVKPEVTVEDSLTSHGVLRLRVHEARVTRVLFSGDTGRYLPALEEIGARLEAAQPLRKDDLPTALRAMRRIAGMSVSINTRRDAEVRNAFELLVHAEFSAVEGLVRMNNRGTDQVGPAFILGQLFVNGLVGRDEKLGLMFASATDPHEYLGEDCISTPRWETTARAAMRCCTARAQIPTRSR